MYKTLLLPYMSRLKNFRKITIFFAVFVTCYTGSKFNDALVHKSSLLNKTGRGSVELAMRSEDCWNKIGNSSVMNGIDLKNCGQALIPHDLFVPIFVMSRDRVSSLKRSLKSYRDTIKSPYEIIVLDHHSTFPPMVEYLQYLSATQNISVFHLVEASWDAALEEASQLIQDYLVQHPTAAFFVFTDQDIAFLRTAPDVLLYYAAVLRSCPEYNVVGPALQISDIPLHYSGRSPKQDNKTVYEWESAFWTGVPSMATWNGIGYHVAIQPIDTTFAMYRRETKFTRLINPCLRAYAPYSAVHVDWYDDSSNLPADKLHYVNKQNGVNNW